MTLRQDTINVLGIQGGGTGGSTVTEALVSLGLNVRSLPLDANIDTYGPTAAYIGQWAKNTSTNAQPAFGFPEENAVGTLEVINGGAFGGLQRYNSRSGNIYLRSLTGSWNGTNGPWSPWLPVGFCSVPGYFTSDMNTLLTPGIWSITNAVTNGPLPAGQTLTPTGICKVELRSSSNSVVQTFTSIVTNAAFINRTWTRTLSGATWSSWDLQGAAALSDLGYGLTASPRIAPFDWQQADFLTGSMQTFVFSSSLNPPPGVSYNTNTTVTATTIQRNSNASVVKLNSLSASNGDRSEFIIVVTGTPGSRSFNVTRSYNSDSTTTIPITNGGTGASTAAAARTNLGLGSSSTYNVGTSGNNIAVLNGSNTWSSSQTISANLFTVGSAATGNTYFKIGNLTQTASVLLDFRSSGLSNDYDARVQVTGGVQGTNGKGTYSIAADIFNVTSASAVNFNSADLRAKSLLLTNALPVTSGGTGGNTPALARKGLELDETATDIDFRGAKVTTREAHASGIFASKPSSGGVNGGQLKSDCIIAGVEVASAYLQMLKTVNSTDTTARLTVYQKGTGGVGGSESTKNFDFASNGNFYMDGTQYVGGVVATNIVANNTISAAGSILANAGANVGVAPHNTNSNNGIRLWAHTNDADQGQYVNTVSGGWYAGNWALGAVRGGGTDLRACQLNVSGGSGGGNASYMFKPNGVADGLQWNNVSDRRQKKDIKTVENPIEKMKQFHGVTFTYLNGVPSAGYIAQDVQEVLPEVVTADHEGMLSMNVAGVGALHHEAILALIARVEELEKKIAELTSQ